MAFSFNFQIDPKDIGNDIDNFGISTSCENQANKSKSIGLISDKSSGQLKELSLELDELPVCEDDVVTSVQLLKGSTDPNASVSYYCPEEVSLWAKANDLMPVDSEQSTDLVSGVYEGGLQLWECSEDLATWLLDKAELQPGLRVMELGCGAGLPGLSCLRRHRPVKVAFQDFNPEVLRAWTMPNCRLNLADLARPPQLEFLAGSWAGLAAWEAARGAFDLVLTAETIYNPDYYQQLHDALSHLLAPDGVALVAAKVSYFGVGGSESLFCDFLDRRGQFSHSTAMRTESAALARVILELRRRR